MQYVSKLLIISVVAGLFVTAGCVSQKQTMVNQGFPLSYVDGFDDGCHSGKKAGGNIFEQFKKDVNRFGIDRQYAQGWSDGLRQCETEQEAIQRQIRMGMEQQQFMELKKHNDWEDQRHLESELLRGIDTSGLKNLK